MSSRTLGEQLAPGEREGEREREKESSAARRRVS